MTRNSESLESFTEYCRTHPELRFWQALRNWSKWGFVVVTNRLDAVHAAQEVDERAQDTFYWEVNRPPYEEQ